MNVKDAISVRNRLADRWRSPIYAAAWQESRRDRGVEMSVKPDDMPIMQASTLPDSPAYFVDDDALDVLAAAVPTFSPEPLLAEDFMTPAGFMLLTRPLFAYSPDENDLSVITAPYDWMAIPTRGPLAICWWPLNMPPGDEWQAGERVIGGGIAARGDVPSGGAHIAGYLYSNAREWVLASSMAIPFGSDFWVRSPEGSRATLTFMRPFQALLRLMAQEVLATTRIASSQSRKRSRRAGRQESVLVVRLPRRAGSSNGHGHGGTVEWSKQWWVNGHWRNQWYPRLETHRQRWIHGYVKGPGDKPFEPHVERAFAVGD